MPHKILPLLIMTIILGQMSTDVYLPSLPSLLATFQSTEEVMKLTLSIYLFSFGLVQLVAGPISDSIGRRQVCLLGGLIYLAGSTLCYCATTGEQLLFGRFIQGLGIGCAGVVCSAMVRDLHQGVALAKAISICAIVITLSPILAPVLGGYLHDSYGEFSSFFFLMLYAMFLWPLLYTFIPSQVITKPSQPILATVKYNYRTVLKHRPFWLCAITSCTGYSAFMIYLVFSPFLFQEQLGFSASQQGGVMLYVAVGYLTGVFINARLLTWVPAYQIMLMGTCFSLVGASAMLMCAMLGIINVYSLILPMTTYVFGSGISNPCVSAALLKPFPQAAGTAIAANNCLLRVGAALISALVVMLPSHSFWQLSVAILCCVLVKSVIVWFALEAEHVSLDLEGGKTATA